MGETCYKNRLVVKVPSPKANKRQQPCNDGYSALQSSLQQILLEKSVAGSELPRSISVPDIRRDSSQSLFAVFQIIGFHLPISDIRKAIGFKPLELVVFVANVQHRLVVGGRLRSGRLVFPAGGESFLLNAGSLPCLPTNKAWSLDSGSFCTNFGSASPIRTPGAYCRA
jgi:hypothetical protein